MEPMGAALAVAAVTIALAGACVGSFTTVVIERLPRALPEPDEFGDHFTTNPWREVLGGRSRCDSCGHPIRPQDNIPLLSWLILRGRCRDCGTHIPARTLWVEAAVPLLWLYSLAALGWDWRLLPLCVFLPMGLAMAVIDLRTFIVPTRLVWPATVGTVALSVVAAWQAGEWGWLTAAATGAAVVSGLLFTIWWIRPDGMGFGDVRLGVSVGWLVGLLMGAAGPLAGAFGGVMTLFLSSALGLSAALAMRVGPGRRIPFGPALVASVVMMTGLSGPVGRLVA